MNPLRPALLALALVLGACSCSDDAAPSGPAAERPEELLRQLHLALDELAARPEHAAGEVSFQHLLVGVAGGVAGVERTAAEAELLAAGFFSRARAGEDFDLLVKNHTDEKHPGIYTLTTSGTPDPAHSTFPRSGMVPAVGDVAWRLAVGELGVAAYDGGVPGGTPRCPLGYHVVKRLK